MVKKQKQTDLQQAPCIRVSLAWAFFEVNISHLGLMVEEMMYGQQYYMNRVSLCAVEMSSYSRPAYRVCCMAASHQAGACGRAGAGPTVGRRRGSPSRSMTNGWGMDRIRRRAGSDIDALICLAMALELYLPGMELRLHLQGLRASTPDPSVSRVRPPSPTSRPRRGS